MRFARVERSAVAALFLFSASVFALKGVAVNRVVRRRINDKSARFGTPGPQPVDVENMETRAYSMPITVLSPEESAVDRRRVKADEDGGDREREAWKFLSHSKNSLDLAEIVNSVEHLEPKSGDVESQTSSTSTDGTTTSTTPSTTTTKYTEKPPSRLPPLITPLVPFSNDVSPIVGFSLVRAENSSLHGKRGRIEFVNTFTDLNGAWDGRRSAFLCKMPGLYFFSFNARGITTGSNEDLWIVSLMLNGVEVVSIGGGNESGSSNSILLALNRYDEVWLQLMQGSLTESKDRSRTGMTSFSGYRIGGISPRDISENAKGEREKDNEIPERRHQSSAERDKRPDRFSGYPGRQPYVSAEDDGLRRRNGHNQNRRPSNDWSGDSWGKGDRRRKRPEIIYVVRPSEDDDGSGENRRRERPQDHHRPRPEPDRVYHYFPDKKYDRDRRRNSWDRNDLNSDNRVRPYTSLRAAAASSASVKDIGDVAAVIERLEGHDSRRRLVIRT